MTRPGRACSVADCDRPVQARGWCVMHWSRWRRNGDPERLQAKPMPLFEGAEGQPGVCSVPDCGRKIRARGVCVTHYQRWRDTGNVDADRPVAIVGDDDARFWANVDKRGSEDCWHWTGNRDKTGYGLFSVGGVNSQESRLAHRWSYKRFRTRVSADQHVDHVCHNRDRSCRRGPQCQHRRCVNPNHLEAVSPQENVYRAYGANASLCPAGHPRTEENTKVDSQGTKRCLECTRRRGREYARRKAEEARSTSSPG